MTEQEYEQHRLDVPGDFVWTLTDTGYCTEASDLPRQPQCPACHALLLPSDLVARRTGDDITCWSGVHACGAALTIFND